MLTQPDLDEDKIAAGVQANYDLHLREVAFLPLGADVNTAVYHLLTRDNTPFFLKLRRGHFAEVSIALPRFLRDLGIAQMIAPLPTRAGQLWAALEGYTAVLYPFIAGQDGYHVALTDGQWVEFGAALRRVHTAVLPPALLSQLRRETYSAKFRETVRGFLAQVERQETFVDAIAAELAAFLRAQQDEIVHLCRRADQLANNLRKQPPKLALCHADIHAGNLHITPGGAFYLVDWDEALLAPKERDLMSIGGGLMGSWRSAEAETAVFYQGYGDVPLHATALAYYRYERIIQDIAAYCEELLLTAVGGEDRPQSLHYVKSNFRPAGTIAQARAADALI